MTELAGNDLRVASRGKTLLDVPRFVLPDVPLTVLVGPNGAGKSTLLRCLAGILAPDAGGVTLDTRPLQGISPARRRQLLGYLPQHRELAWPLRVRDVVALGCGAASAERLGSQEEAQLCAALERFGLSALASRPADRISGGELTRVHLARLIAGNADILLADEPLTGLDLRHQLAFLADLQRGLRAGQRALLALHDLELAARFAQHLVVMNQGRIVDSGPPDAVLTAARLGTVFGLSLPTEPPAADYGFSLRGVAPIAGAG
jgi:iron complex transport system ATP-binding protein